MSSAELKTNEAPVQQSAQKKEGLSLFGVNKGEIQGINDLSSEYEKTKDQWTLTRLTQAKLEAAKNAVNNELENYLAGYGNPAQKVDRAALEKSFNEMKSTNPAGLAQSENMGHILLSFLDNYSKLSSQIAVKRTTEQKPHRELTLINTKDLQSAIKVDIASLLKTSPTDLNNSQQISEADAKLLDNARKTADTAAASGDYLEKFINQSTKTQTTKEAKSAPKPKLSDEQKVNITETYLTAELVNATINPKAKRIINDIRSASSAAQSVKSTIELQNLIGTTPDGTFGRNSVTELKKFNRDSELAKVEKKPTKAENITKEYADGVAKAAQENADKISVNELSSKYKQTLSLLENPDQPQEAKVYLSHLLAYINTKAHNNNITLPYESKEAPMQTVTITAKSPNSKKGERIG